MATTKTNKKSARRLRRPEKLERLSKSEWEMMMICWRLGECTVHQVLEESLANTVRDYKTVLTFLFRMQGKGYLETRKVGKTNYYTPAVSKNEALRYEAACFLKEYVGEEEDDRRIVLEVFESQRKKKRSRRAPARLARKAS